MLRACLLINCTLERSLLLIKIQAHSAEAIQIASYSELGRSQHGTSGGQQ